MPRTGTPDGCRTPAAAGVCCKLGHHLSHNRDGIGRTYTMAIHSLRTNALVQKRRWWATKTTCTAEYYHASAAVMTRTLLAMLRNAAE